MPDSDNRIDYTNMSLEQRRMIWTEALQELGGIIEVLSRTGWNPFASDAPAISSSKDEESDSYSGGHFYDFESGLSAAGAFYYEVLEDGQRDKMLGGEYRVFSNGKKTEGDDKSLVRHFIDIRREDSTIKYVVFGPEIATIVAPDEAYRYDISGVVETLRSTDRRTVAIGVEKKIDGTENVFIDLMHINFDTEDVLRSSYRIGIDDYVRGKYNVNGIFGMQGTQEFIQGLSSVLPEMFSDELSSRYPNTRVIAKGNGFKLVEETIILNTDDVVFEGDEEGRMGIRSIGIDRPFYRDGDLPEYTDRRLESAEEIDDELLTYIRYCLACHRYEDVSDELVQLANQGQIDNKTGFGLDELDERIKAGWVVVAEFDEKITLLPFKIRDHDRAVLFNSGIGIETDEDIVSNIARERIWVQRGAYEDYRLETPEEIDAEEVYDLLKRGYVDFVDVMDRVMKSVWPIPEMSSEMTLDKIAECIHFGLKSGTLKAELVEGVCGSEYKLSTTEWELEEDVEVLTRHLNRLELMTRLARPQDYNGSLRAMLEAGILNDESGIPYSGIEEVPVSGELEYSYIDETVRYKRYRSSPEVEDIRKAMSLSHPEEVLHNFARRRIEYSEVGYLQKGFIDKREDISSELNTNQLDVLLEKGYVNIVGIEDELTRDGSLFEIDSDDQFLARIANIIRTGIEGGQFVSEMVEGKYGLEYVIAKKEQNKTATDIVPPPLFPTLGGSHTFSPIIDRPREHRRLPVGNGEEEIVNLPSVTIDEVETKFGVSVEGLKERIANVVDRPTRQGLIRAGMWDTSQLIQQNLRQTPRKVIEINSHQLGGVNVNTAIVSSVEDIEGIVGVLTDVDTTNGEEIRTMVVDFRRVNTGGETKLIVTCLERVLPRNNIKLPTTDDGGFVFELVFDEPDAKLEPAIVMRALQALDLTSGDTGPGYKINRYILSQSQDGNRYNS